MRRLLPGLFLLAAALAACGGGGDDTPGTSATPTPARTIGPLPTGTTCQPGNGPPSEGQAGDLGLDGQITYVRLIFGCQPDVYTMHADGSEARPLADDLALDDESDLSYDGSRVVFFSGREGNAFIYTMNADGSDLKKITTGGGGDTSPRWSPDGSLIAYSRSGSLAVMNPDGTNGHVIMEAQTGEPAACRAGSFVGGWSPDGKRIVYYSAIVRSNAENTFWICTISVDGGDPQVLIDEPGLHAEPYWSPDGDKIVYRDDDNGSCSGQTSPNCNYEVFVLDLSTGERTNVTKDPAFDIEPVWSPDGKWILFASNREDPNFDLYVIRPDGSDVHRVLADPDSKDSYPSWH